MTQDWLYLLVPIGSVLTNILGQVFYYRNMRLKSLPRSASVGYLAGFIFLIGASLYLYVHYSIGLDDFLFLLLTNFMAYCGLWYWWYGFIGLGVSLRIRMLDMLSRSPNGMTSEEMAARFNSIKLIDVRLERLIRGRDIEAINNRYFIKPSKILLVAKFVCFLKILFTGKASEFEN